ncbi:hypothetical protein BKA93DRAFT_750471 [Sparassis latifolia]
MTRPFSDCRSMILIRGAVFHTTLHCSAIQARETDSPGWAKGKRGRCVDQRSLTPPVEVKNSEKTPLDVEQPIAKTFAALPINTRQAVGDYCTLKGSIGVVEIYITSAEKTTMTGSSRRLVEESGPQVARRLIKKPRYLESAFAEFCRDASMTAKTHRMIQVEGACQWKAQTLEVECPRLCVARSDPKKFAITGLYLAGATQRHLSTMVNIALKNTEKPPVVFYVPYQHHMGCRRLSRQVLRGGTRSAKLLAYPGQR